MKKLSIKFLFIFLLLSISVVSISYFSNNLNSNKDIKAKDYKKVTAVRRKTSNWNCKNFKEIKLLK